MVTAGALSSGIAMALHLVERFAGRELAERAANQIDYVWTETTTACQPVPTGVRHQPGRADDWRSLAVDRGAVNAERAGMIARRSAASRFLRVSPASWLTIEHMFDTIVLMFPLFSLGSDGSVVSLGRCCTGARLR